MEQTEIEELKIMQDDTEVAIQETVKTHISWIFLTNQYAYKIKKPIKTSFLDYSTLPKRKYYCEKEILLNRRLTDDIYLKVVPVMLYDNAFFIDGTKGRTIDYAVMMKKMNHHHQMDILLEEGKVTSFAIKHIARKVAHFHQKVKKVVLTIDQDSLKHDFNDILTALPCVAEYLGSAYRKIIERACAQSNAFLEENTALMRKRVSQGYYRNCHGDLHAKNIILEEEPVIFDCIEFNDALRHIDVLNEIAFFCMELEVMDKEALSNFFVKEYISNTAFEYGPPLKNLMRYYKMYRANIRAKVVAMELSDKGDGKHDKESLVSKLKNYLDLMGVYCNMLNNPDKETP